MRRLILSFGLAVGTLGVYAQSGNVGIGTDAPENSAILELKSTNKGFLLPRMTEAQKNKITSPAIGLKVYQTDGRLGEYTYNGSAWVNSTAEVAGWALTGNSGTIPESHFIGTTDAQPLIFKVGNVKSGIIESAGKLSVFLGYEAGLSGTSFHNIGIGHQVLKSSTGSQNVGLGYQALLSNTSGVLNIGLGYQTLKSNTSGNNNIGVGGRALEGNLTGTANTAIGYASMFSNQAGNSNTAYGAYSLYSMNGGASNTAIGVYAGYSANGVTNVAIGNSSFRYNSSGNNNVAIGYYAGASSDGHSNVYLGYLSGQNATGNNKLYISNSSTLTPLLYGDFSAKFLSIGDVAVAKRDAIASTGQYSLLVEKGILCEKVKVALKSTADWADYVFEPGYQKAMLSLEEVEAYTKKHKHLPNVASARELKNEGLDITQTSAKLMEKIEELTLYLIQINKEVKALRSENEKLKAETGK